MKVIASIILFATFIFFFSSCGKSDQVYRSHPLSDMEEKLIGDWKGRNGIGTYIYADADNKIIAVNEDGKYDQLIVEGRSIKALTWKVHPSFSDNGKKLNWGNGTAWSR